MNKKRTYIAIDLKSFYASVECIARGLDPLTSNLVVADKSRTNKTICLAVSPALKSFGVPGRPRLFQVEQRVKNFNQKRQRHLVGRKFKHYSINRREIEQNKAMGLSYEIARPRMKYYEQVSAQIYGIYLRYIAPEDIHVYSIDEAFIDATPYLKTYNCTAHELAEKMISEVYHETGLTATVGIGTNLYLAKVAMDILAKHMQPTKHGIKIASLNGLKYRQLLWDHQPLTDFWRIGRGYQKRLQRLGLHTMGEIAACSEGKLSDQYNEELLYREFGKNAEILIDHAWGYEPLTIQDIKQYQPRQHCLCVGQLLEKPYPYNKGLMIINEMSEELALKLTQTKQKAQRLSISIHYDEQTLSILPEVDELELDRFGRTRPKSVRNTAKLPHATNSITLIKQTLRQLFNDCVNSAYLLRRITLTAEDILSNEVAEDYLEYEQTNLFEKPHIDFDESREIKRQDTVLKIKERFGNNAVFRAVDLEEGAMTLRRNQQIGGHLA